MLAPPFTPYGWQTTSNMVQLYHGVPRILKNKDDPAWQNKVRYRMSGLPIVKDLMVYEDQNRRMEDYLKNRGLSWEDVKYPSLLYGAGSGGRLVTDVASVARLYR